MTTQRTCWVVIPAAGMGTRMGGNIPKQYLPLRGKTVIEHTVDRLLQLEQVAGIVIALSEHDSHWTSLPLAKIEKIHTTTGGAERCNSVLNGLRYLETLAHPDDLVLVHDAARPCVRIGDIVRVIEAARTCQDGAILAIPVRDTLKRAGSFGFIESTVDRAKLWQAQTPQAFGLALLREALEQAIANRTLVTDDAQAIELTGRKPFLVEGHPDNLKITDPSDLNLALLYLQNQEQSP